MSAPKSLPRRIEIRYGIVGLINTLVGLCIIYCLKWFGVGDVVSNAVGYLCGLLLSFSLNSRWTFSYEGKVFPAFWKFVLIILVSYFVNLKVVMTAIHIFGINSYVAQTLGTIPFTLITYFGSKLIVFRK
jgi:putative flippase GtrA